MTTKTLPDSDRTAIGAAIAAVDADLIATEARFRDLTLVAAAARIRGKRDVGALDAARAEVANLKDIRAGLVAHDVLAETRELEVDSEAQRCVDEEVDAKLRELLPRRQAAWYGGYNVERVDQNRQRLQLDREIEQETLRRQVARERSATISTRLAELRRAHPDLFATAKPGTEVGR